MSELEQMEYVKVDKNEPIHFDLVEPAKNSHAWTPTYLCILSPLNRSGRVRSDVSTTVAKDADDSGLLPMEASRALAVPLAAVMAVMDAAGLARKTRYPLATYERLVWAAVPKGWIPKTTLLEATHTSESVYTRMVKEGHVVKVVKVGGVDFHSPEVMSDLVDYKILSARRFKEAQARERAAARKAAQAVPPEERRHVSVTMAAAILGIGDHAVSSMVKRGEIRSDGKRGQAILLLAADVLKWKALIGKTVTLEEFASLIGRTRQRASEVVRDKKINTVKVGPYLRVYKDAVEAYLAARE